MYVKLAGSILVLLSLSYAGWSAGERGRQRIRMLSEWRKLLALMEGEVRCCQIPLAEVFAHAGSRSYGAFAAWLTWLSGELERYGGKTFRQIWEEGIERYLRDTPLKEADLLEIRELGSQLGFLDVRMQESVLQQESVQLAHTIAELEKAFPQKQKLCRMLGVSAGLFCIVVFL